METDVIEFKFSELSEKAKQKAREAYTSDGYLDYEWWDAIYEDAMRMGALMGIEISTTTRLSGRDRKTPVKDISIFFSGFSSQGNGASFEGNYSYVPDAVQKIRAETTDEELIRIAQELTLLQITRRLRGLSEFSATIGISGSGCHSITMGVEVNSEDENDEHSQITESEEDDVTQLMRDFADWIYKQLEAENDWLHSDECVDQYLADETFDKEGAII